MLMNTKLKHLALASLVATASLMAQTPYDEGQKALRDQRWSEAAEQFETAIESDQEQADSATYWRAYALFKAGRGAEAERELRRLERNYPDSRWIRDAQTLRLEHQDSARSIERLTDDDAVMDEELKLFALAQLIERDPERAMPLLLDLLHNAESPAIRQDALFVLAMSEEPEALSVLNQVARDSGNPELQINAIQILGSVASDAALPLLAELYTKDASTEVRRAIIHAYVVGDDPQPLLELYESETDPELRKSIIHSLGAMGANDQLQSIFSNLQDTRLKVAVIEAFSISGDSSALVELLNTERNPEVRRAAINGIAINGGPDAPAFLQSLYENSSSTSEKGDILEALIMLDESDELAMQIIKTEDDAELRRKAIHVLGINESTEELADLYRTIPDTDSRKAVLESMSIADDSDGLIQILETEDNEDLRKTAINYLAVTDDESAGRYLKTLYSTGSKEEKGAVIQSMMIMDDAQGLIELMKQEKDPNLKRQMLQMLTMMDSEETNEYLFELMEDE